MTNNAGPSAVFSARTEFLSELLTDETIRLVILDFMKKNQCRDAQCIMTPSGPMFKGSGTTIFINRGQINVEMGAFKFKEAAVWKQEISKLLERASGLLFQQKVNHLIRSHYPIDQDQKASNGALVLTINPSATEGSKGIRIAILPDGRIAVFSAEGEALEAAAHIRVLFDRLRKHGMVEESAGV